MPAIHVKMNIYEHHNGAAVERDIALYHAPEELARYARAVFEIRHREVVFYDRHGGMCAWRTARAVHIGAAAMEQEFREILAKW